METMPPVTEPFDEQREEGLDHEDGHLSDDEQRAHQAEAFVREHQSDIVYDGVLLCLGVRHGHLLDPEHDDESSDRAKCGGDEEDLPVADQVGQDTTDGGAKDRSGSCCRLQESEGIADPVPRCTRGHECKRGGDEATDHSLEKAKHQELPDVLGKTDQRLREGKSE
jgi:hypothetical protein